MSMSNPRVIRNPTFSMPSLVKPVRVEISSSLKQLYMLAPMVWWLKPSNWVPTCPISAITSSSLLPRWLDSGFILVRFVITPNWRPAESGIDALSTWPNSITSPVRISREARSTVWGFIRFAEPR